MTTYYYEVPTRNHTFRTPRIEADSDDEARALVPEDCAILYRESDTADGVPFVEIPLAPTQ